MSFFPEPTGCVTEMGPGGLGGASVVSSLNFGIESDFPLCLSVCLSLLSLSLSLSLSLCLCLCLCLSLSLSLSLSLFAEKEVHLVWILLPTWICWKFGGSLFTKECVVCISNQPACFR